MDILYLHNVKSEDNIEYLLDIILSQIPHWRLTKVLSYKKIIDKYLCAKAYLILKEGLSNDFGIKDEIQFSYNYFGKPYISNYPKIHFNLSHCRKGIACAISSNPIGVDIEEILFDNDIAKFILNKDEYKHIISSNNPAECFTRKWTEKESYVKMLGCGLVDNMKGLVIQNAFFSTIIERNAGYVVTLCKNNNNNTPYKIV